MERAFLSYRREDSDYALLLYEYLKQNFGRDRIFLDTAFIEPGQDFVDILERELATCVAFIALIGRGWLESLSRLQDPNDYVRLEISSVLKRGTLLVPVLAGHALMPRPQEFPAALAQLSRLSTLEIRVDSDLATLTRVLGRTIPRFEPEPAVGDPVQARVIELLKRQAHRSQVRVVGLVAQGEMQQAFDELNDSIEIILCLQQWIPADAGLDLHLAYIYKTLSQTYDSAGSPERAREYADLAASVFERAFAGDAEKRYSPSDRASAFNGLGNIYYQRGDFDQAIKLSLAAVQLAPDYAYAWHDLFGALVARAQRGDVDLPAMHNAIEQLQRTGAGQPGLDARYLAQLAEHLRRWEQPPEQKATPKRRTGRKNP
jgi:tetratricopeptide (TPR) repeat protein